MKKIFLSSPAKKTSIDIFPKLQAKKVPYYLLSFYYANKAIWPAALNYCDEILIDSGAHTFQVQNAKSKKKKTYDDYLKKYIEFIQNNTKNKKILGFFELDVDCDVGYAKVLEYRTKLEAVSDKIIPVWHKNRGIKEFIKMCQDYSGKIVAVSGFKDEDISDEQFHLFCGVANKYNAKLHILGMTRVDLIDKLDFYSCDSSTYCAPVQWRKGSCISI